MSAAASERHRVGPATAMADLMVLLLLVLMLAWNLGGRPESAESPGGTSPIRFVSIVLGGDFEPCPGAAGGLKAEFGGTILTEWPCENPGELDQGVIWDLERRTDGSVEILTYFVGEVEGEFRLEAQGSRVPGEVGVSCGIASELETRRPESRSLPVQLTVERMTVR